MTTTEFLDLLIAELDQLRAENRRLNLELAAARSQRDAVQAPVRL
jgi:cell division septum initiation protein DivIVA